jgi:hypothetical protein
MMKQNSKRLYIIVEGQTEEEFVKTLLHPYCIAQNIYDVRPIKIQTGQHRGKRFKGGFINYQHLRRDAIHHLKQENSSIVSMFVDFFRMPPSVPNYADCIQKSTTSLQIECLESAISKDIGYPSRFIPYIQRHEFEALLFASNAGFEKYFSAKASQTKAIIEQYPNPEDINNHPETAPSKRLLGIIPSYNKVIDGNILALETGLQEILAKCPCFRAWVNRLVTAFHN